MHLFTSNNFEDVISLKTISNSTRRVMDVFALRRRPWFDHQHIILSIFGVRGKASKVSKGPAKYYLHWLHWLPVCLYLSFSHRDRHIFSFHIPFSIHCASISTANTDTWISLSLSLCLSCSLCLSQSLQTRTTSVLTVHWQVVFGL